jgi:DUF4097 and DUF4098 domain-containing protein YvlB
MRFTIDGRRLDVDIRLTRTKLDIEEHDRPDIELSFSELRRNTAEELFSVTCRDNLLTIQEKVWQRPAVATAFFNAELQAHLILKVPSGTRLFGRITTVSGDLCAPVLRLEGKIKTISGRMTFGSVEAQWLRLQNIGGSLEIETMNGGLSARIITGRCRIAQGRITALSLNGVSSDVAIKADYELKKDADIHTVSGDIHLEIGSYQGERRLVLSSLSGRVTVEGGYPKDRVEIRKRMPFLKQHPFREVMPAVKNVVSSLAAMAREGNVEVRTGKEDEETEQNVRLILQMLSEGKITATEAEKLIAALKG